MLKGMFLLCLCLCQAFFFPAARAQQGTVISGQVADSISRRPVEFATIVLMQAATRRTIAQVLADDKGSFRIPDVRPGSYQVGITMLGYRPHLIDSIKIDTLQPALLMGTRYLAQITQQLVGVTVSAQRPLLEMKDDKLIYNVENDADKDRVSASEMLRKVPMVTVDPEGNIQLKGSSSFKVLVNGKNTSMVARNPKEALKAFPANVIKSIEVITSPSAKYEAEGAAGIINIITQKNYNGFNGSVFANTNSLGSHTGGASFSVRQGKLGISTMANGTFMNNNRSSSDLKREDLLPGLKGTMEQHSTPHLSGSLMQANLELTYDFDTLNNITLYGNLGTNPGKTNVFQTLLTKDSAGQILNSGEYGSFTRVKGTIYDVGMDYQHKFKKQDHQLSFSANRNYYTYHTTVNNEQYNTHIPDNFYRNITEDDVTENTLQLDYVLPLPHGQRFEAGTKGIFRQTGSAYEQLARDSSGYYKIVPDRANTFTYYQNVLALYAMYRFKIKEKTSIMAGTRLEHTSIHGDFATQQTSIRTSYLNLMPSLHITRELKGLNSLSFSYGLRLQRPWIWYLNPYINDNDPNNISYGNPSLSPEKTHSFSAMLNLFIKKITLNTSIDYMLTNNSIESIIRSNKGRTETTYDNIGHRSTGGINVSIRSAITNEWNVNLNSSLNYLSMKSNNGNNNFDTKGWFTNVAVSTDYNFGKGFRADINFFYTSKLPTLQGSSSAIIGYSLGVGKTLLNDKANITFGIDQPFEGYRIMRNETRETSFYQLSTSYNPARAFRASISWRFGEMKEAATKKKGVSNDDLKKK